jgi:hypothetical protein
MMASFFPRARWVLVALALLSTAALAPSGSGYDLSWHTVDGGGCTVSRGGGYLLGATIGQPDAGLLSGGGYTLGGGFWAGGAGETTFRLYLPLTLRGS